MEQSIDTTEMYIRIKALSKEKYGSVSKMLQSCGLAKNTVDNIKNGSMPSSDKLDLIASALEVSLDYILKGENTKKEQPPFSDLRKQLEDICDSMSEEEQMELLKLGKMIRDAHALREKSSPE